MMFLPVASDFDNLMRAHARQRRQLRLARMFGYITPEEFERKKGLMIAAFTFRHNEIYRRVYPKRWAEGIIL